MLQAQCLNIYICYECVNFFVCMYNVQILPALLLLLQHEDNEVKANTCWALSFLTSGTNEQIQVISPLIKKEEEASISIFKALVFLLSGCMCR